MTPDGRPDPDALLARVQDQQKQDRRGRLRVFLGFAPGVGKTCRMLQVARDLVTDQHLDVVVGIVEVHGRPDTAAMVLGLDLLPRRKVEYRGRTLEELDLDAALARRPDVILVDELAHTNAPGSRHARRWQDVEELLEAGVDVLTTLNVQHVESLNDVVAQVTGVRVRETVPDAVLDAAQAVELVDISPEELVQRLRDGKVYAGPQAERAAVNFFQRGNLLALRELALRRTAQHVDEDVREYRALHGVNATWPTGERVLVCVGPAPSSARLVRAAARMAAGLRCPWSAAWVVSPAGTELSPADRASLDAHLQLASSLGATVTRLAGMDVAATILAHARAQNVTRIIVGKPTHPRLVDRLRGSLLDELVRGSGDIDILVIHGDGDVRPVPAPSTRDVARGPGPREHAGAAGLVATALGLSFVLRALLDLPDLEMLFLLAVMTAGAWFGRGPALTAAALSVAAYDFFLVPPFHTFSVEDRRHVLTFAMMFGVGIAMSALADRLRRQERDAVAREERTAALYALTRELASARDEQAVADVAARHASGLLDARVHVLQSGADAAVTCTAVHPAGAALDEKDMGVARWALDHDVDAGAGTDTLPGAHVTCLPLRGGRRGLGVLAVEVHARGNVVAEHRDVLDVLRRQVGLALERARLSGEARSADLRARTEEMRSALLSAVSHDLRTPLASITGSATALRDDQGLDPATRGDLLDSIVSEAERLERLVGNLLDMTRLESGAVTPRREWIPVDEVVGAATTRVETRTTGRDVTVDVPPGLPMLHVDAVLVQQLLLNLLENALRHTPAGTPIHVGASRHGAMVDIAVEDRGPGLGAGMESRVFEKFFRAAAPGVSGAGLGLAICRAIAEAHGGSIRARARDGGGASFVVTLPAGTPPAGVEMGSAA